MWKAYKYTYYWLYTWQKKLWGEIDLPQYNVILGLSLSFFAILGSIAIIVDIFIDVMIISTEIPKAKVLAFNFGVLIIHHFLFVQNGKYKKIEQEFKGESKEERKRKGTWVLLYTFGSLAFFIFLMIFGIWVKH
ncbi:MAG: hypothetical protein CVU03_06255 [Bacteroidetes bacterium HGW-Bacteroidetes-2]|jgi:hypothetical protein|nr:MAG: hypothetical protein CVU03_06255 [Bacteroidetes bacterium HGW-Bacteroidetes-2]